MEERTRLFRRAAFALLAVYIALGPFARQVLGIPTPFLPRWRMFHDIGLDLMDARWTSRSSDGREVELVPPGSPHVRSVAEAKAIAVRFCAGLGRDADVRLYLRSPSTDGWFEVERAEENLCSIP